MCKRTKRRAVNLAAHCAMTEVDEIDSAIELPRHAPAQTVASNHGTYETIYRYFASISARKAEGRSMKSASFNLISSPTRYFNTDLVGSSLIVLSAHKIPLLFIIELHSTLTEGGA
jgi:hypothetical protein